MTVPASFLSFSWTSAATVTETETDSKPRSWGEGVRSVPKVHPISGPRPSVGAEDSVRAELEMELRAKGISPGRVRQHSGALVGLGFAGAWDLGRATLRELRAAGIDEADAVLMLGIGRECAVQVGRL